jgi:Transposase DDE domain
MAARFGSIALVRTDAGDANHIDNRPVTWANKSINVGLQIVKRRDNACGFQARCRAVGWVERTFGWLIRNRRLGRDYEGLTDNAETVIKVAMVHPMATRLASEQIHWSNRAM